MNVQDLLDVRKLLVERGKFGRAVKVTEVLHAILKRIGPVAERPRPDGWVYIWSTAPCRGISSRRVLLAE